MPVDPGDIVRAVASFVLADGTIAQNILHFIASFGSQATDATVLTAIKQYIQDLYVAIDGHIDANVAVDLCWAHVVEFDEGEGDWITARLIGSTSPAITFTSSVDPQPNQISPVLVANTTRPKTRGRKFLLPFSDNSADGSEWTSTVLTDLTTSLNHLLADEAVSAGNWLSPGVPRAGVDDFREFTNGSVSSIVGTQRRRKPGVGF